MGDGSVHASFGGPPPGWVNTPITIDREGRMWNEGAEIVHDRLVDFLRKHLRPDPDNGGWEIYVSPRERKPVIVEDAPFQVLSCWGTGGTPPEELRVITYDGAEEAIDPATIELRANVPYCLVKDSTALARFSRQAAEQLSRLYEEAEGKVVIRMRNRDYPVGSA